MKRRWGLAVVAIGLLVATGWLERVAREQRGDAETRPPDFLYGALFGGLRAPIAAMRWLEADLDFRKGLYFETVRDLRAVAALSPRGTNAIGQSVWDYGAWHLAFNVSKMAADEPTRCRYVVEGYRLGLDGLRILPDNPQLRLICARIADRKGEACRAAFERAFGVAPERAAWHHLLPLRSFFRDDIGALGGWVSWLAITAEKWGQRLIVTDRPEEAQNVFSTLLESLDLTRRLTEEGKASPGGPVSALIRERESAEKWRTVARLAASHQKAAAIRCLHEIRGAQPDGADEWIDRIDEVIRHLER